MSKTRYVFTFALNFFSIVVKKNFSLINFSISVCNN